MKPRAEINRFAILLFSSLVSLGNLAPTATLEESKSTTGQKQKHFTTRLKPLALVIEEQATALFKNYNTCSSVTPQTERWLSAGSQAKDVLKKIPDCPAFDGDCCVFHVFHSALQNLRGDVELICGKNLTLFVDANVNQLRVTLIERAARYTCRNEELPRLDCSQVQGTRLAERKMCIWQVLQRYRQLMQKTAKLYSSAEM